MEEQQTLMIDLGEGQRSLTAFGWVRALHLMKVVKLSDAPHHQR